MRVAALVGMGLWFSVFATAASAVPDLPASPAAVEPGSSAPATTAEDSAFDDIVIVTASRNRESLVDAPATTTVISAQAIADSPSVDFAELLRAVPGLNVVQVGVRDINATTRGAAGVVANSQLVLLDGRPINNAFFGNVSWDFFSVERSEIDQIEVVRGPASTMWGAGALSGVINVVTKAPREHQETVIRLGAGGFDRPDGGTADGSGSIFYADASHARATGPRLAYRVSSGFFSHEALTRPSGLVPNGLGTPYPPFKNEDTEQPRFNLRLDYDPNPEQTVRLSAGYAGTEGVVHSPGGPFRQESGNVLAYAQGSYSRGALEVRLYSNYYEGKQSSLLSVGPSGQPVVSDFETQSYELQLSYWRVLAERHLLTVGANLHFDEFDIAIAPLGSSRDDQGLFIEDQFTISDRIQLVAGIRADQFSVLDDPVFSPRVSLLFQPEAHHAIRLGINRAYRAPTLIDNFMDFLIVGQLDLGAFDPGLAGMLFSFPTNVRGAAGLSEVSVTAYELAYSGRLGARTQLEAAYYYSETEDEIVAGTIPYTSVNPPPGWPLPPVLLDVLVGAGAGLPVALDRRNVGGVVNQGIELGLRLDLGPKLGAHANYSWQDTPDPRDVDLSLLNIPPEHRFNLGVDYRGDTLFGNLGVQFTDEATWADVLDARFHGPTDAFTTVDVAVGKEWSAGRLATTLRVTNLLDETIQQHIFGDLIGRRAVLELRYRK